MDEILNLIESVSEGFPSYSFFHRVMECAMCIIIVMLSCDSKWLCIVFNVRLTNASQLMVDNSSVIKIDSVGWLVGCFGFNGPLRQYFSLYRPVSQREGERRERIDES